MPYAAEVSRANPSLMMFLIDQSGSMSDAIAGSNGAKSKAQAVADALNRLLHNLTIKCAKGEIVRDYFDVSVIGYGGPTVGPVFAGALVGRDLVKTSEVANNPARVEQRTKKVEDGAGGLVDQVVRFPVWFDPISNGGTPMCQALGVAHGIVSNWVASHPTSYPPMVINLTDGEATDGDPEPHGTAISGLATNDGGVLMYNCHISATEGAPIIFPSGEEMLPDQYACLLFRMSSPLPEKIRLAAAAERNVAEGARGFAFNADLVDLIRFLDIGTRVASDQR
jgi:hypothetical protein